MEYNGRNIYLPPDGIDPKVIVDLGCWIGITTEAYLIKYPDAHVIGVELSQHNFHSAMSRLNPWYHRTTLVNKVVWTYTGEIDCQMWGEETNYVREIFPPEDHRHGISTTVTLPCVTLDTITADYESIDFIKFDVEGAEHYILGAGGDWVNKTKSMFVEIHDTTNDNVTALIRDLGFKVVREEFEKVWAINDN